MCKPHPLLTVLSLLVWFAISQKQKNHSSRCSRSLLLWRKTLSWVRKVCNETSNKLCTYACQVTLTLCQRWVMLFCHAANSRHLGCQRVYLPLHKVADTPFHIQGDDSSGSVVLLLTLIPRSPILSGRQFIVMILFRWIQNIVVCAHNFVSIGWLHKLCVGPTCFCSGV